MQPAALPAAEDRTVRIMPCMDIPPCNGVSSNAVKRIINYSILFCNAFKMNYHIEQNIAAAVARRVDIKDNTCYLG